MLMIQYRKTLVKVAAVSALFLAFTGIPVLAQTPSTPSEGVPEMPRRSSGMHQGQQQMMMMGQMHELMGQMYQRMGQMTPEQMQEFRPRMMEHHQQMMEQMRQLMEQMPQVEESDVSESNSVPRIAN